MEHHIDEQHHTVLKNASAEECNIETQSRYEYYICKAFSRTKHSLSWNEECSNCILPRFFIALFSVIIDRIFLYEEEVVMDNVDAVERCDAVRPQCIGGKDADMCYGKNILIVSWFGISLLCLPRSAASRLDGFRSMAAFIRQKNHCYSH